MDLLCTREPFVPATPFSFPATWAGTASRSPECAKGWPSRRRSRVDCASLAPLVRALLEEGLSLHCLRDPTRGGLATVLNEGGIALDGGVGVAIDETAVPVTEGVTGARELLGLDPLYVACEGRMVVFLPEAGADRALGILRSHPLGLRASRIARVTEGPNGMVTLKTRLRGRRLLDLLSGEQLPRIC